MAAARSTRLRPIHFIHFIVAAGTNRAGLTSLEECGNYYKFVMSGKQNFGLFLRPRRSEDFLLVQ